MNATTNKFPYIAPVLKIFLIIVGFSFQANCQFYQEENNSYFFLNTIEFDSVAIAELEPSKAKRLYYLQDTFAKKMKPLAKMHCKTSGTRYHRLDDQFENISKKAIELGLNSIKVDSSNVNGISCEYWVSLYRLKFDQIQINESIVKDNLLCVFGEFTDRYELGNTFKINGRKIKLMPYQYVQRNIAHGKRGSVELNGSRLELVGGVNGGEAFYAAPGISLGKISLIAIGAAALAGPLGMTVTYYGGSNLGQIPKNFSYFLYNIYNEKIVEVKTRDALVAAKRKEWREKKTAEEAKKKAKEENKKKD